MQLLRNIVEVFDRILGVRALFSGLHEVDYLASLGVALAALAASWLVGCTALVAVRISRALLPSAGIPLRWSVSVSAGMWLATLGFHLLRSLGAFQLPWALLGCSALLIPARFALSPERSFGHTARRELRAGRALVRLVRREGLLLPGALLSVVVLLFLRALILPPLGWDYVTYHGPRAVHFVQTGEFTFEDGVGPYSFYRHFFAGGEILSAWAILPFRSDLFVSLAGLAQWLGFGLASWALARVLGLRGRSASLGVCVVLLAPLVQLQVHAGYVELALNSALIGGIALALHALRRATRGGVVLSALALGVAAGIKLPGALAGAIVTGALWLRWLTTRHPARSKLLTLGAALLAVLAPVGPFLFRAWRDTGYPLSPVPVRVFGLTLGDASPAVAWYQERGLVPFLWQTEVPPFVRLVTAFANFQDTLGALTLLPWLFAPVGLAMLARRQPLAAAAVAAALVASFSVHFSADMTAVRMLRVGSAARFLISAFALAVPLSLLWCRCVPALGRVYVGLLFVYAFGSSVLAVRLGWGSWESREAVWVASLLVLATALVMYLRQRAAASPLCRRHLPLLAAVALYALGCAALQARRDQTRTLALSHSFALHKLPRYWSEAVPRIDRLDRPERIAITSGPEQSSDGWFLYFFFGRRFQNTIRYIVPTRDGEVTHWGPGDELARRSDYASWLARLSAAKISAVMSFEPRSIEQGWMDAAPQRFQKLAGTKTWGLYRVRPP